MFTAKFKEKSKKDSREDQRAICKGFHLLQPNIATCAPNWKVSTGAGPFPRVVGERSVHLKTIGITFSRTPFFEHSICGTGRILVQDTNVATEIMNKPAWWTKGGEGQHVTFPTFPQYLPTPIYDKCWRSLNVVFLHLLREDNIKHWHRGTPSIVDAFQIEYNT